MCCIPMVLYIFHGQHDPDAVQCSRTSGIFGEVEILINDPHFLYNQLDRDIFKGKILLNYRLRFPYLSGRLIKYNRFQMPQTICFPNQSDHNESFGFSGPKDQVLRGHR